MAQPSRLSLRPSAGETPTRPAGKIPALPLARSSCGTNSTRIDIMRTIIVTGSAGLIGSETVKQLANVAGRGVGTANDIGAQFFGPKASTRKIGDVRSAAVRVT